ncbi:hypothetical protein SADUNF_Sadunf05G0003700 [Salix dunnii]|uniref:Polygalacturonase n=1 Tax=Salix dunnii TaxID=1413687 RepID=A0A835K324_9ROSI|nr:hypothetical protein SADUNF_Sadunf05G0003700 [Salix dunnii]
MLTCSKIFLLAFAFFFFTDTEGRVHAKSRSKHLDIVSHVSLPPATAPPQPPASPSYYKNSPSPSPIQSIARVYNVLSFGAVGDGLTDDTRAFKMAWDTACLQNESAILLAPDDYSFMIQPTIFTGPCKTTLAFQIDGTIMPPDGPEAWPSKMNNRQWLVFYKIKGMSMQGGGVIDGRGEKWWNLPCKPHKGANGTALPGPCDSPVAIRFFVSSDLTLQGLRVKNIPRFHFRFDNCQNVIVQMLSIKSPAQSPNTDGIHIENTNNVQIHNSVVSNGDDCVSIGAGCHNVDIKNITCGPSHGISIGSLGIRNSRACVSNITVTDSVIKYSNNDMAGGYGSVSKITFHNIHMETVRNPIIIDQYYCLTRNCTNQTSSVYISDILYTNIKGTYDVRSPPLHLACSDSVPCTDLKLSEIELLPAQGQFMANPFCWNAYGNLTIPPVSCLLGGIPQFLPQNNIDQCQNNLY